MFEGRTGAFVWISILFLLQNFLSYFFPGECPLFLLIGVIYYSLKQGPRFGFWIGFYAGCFSEFFSQGSFGSGVLPMTAAGLLSGFISSKIFPDGLLTEIFLPLLGAYALSLSELLIVRASSGDNASWSCLWQAFRFWPLFGTSLAAPLIFSWLHRFSSKYRSSSFRYSGP